MTILVVLAGLLLIEAGLIVCVRLQRRAFPWLITEQDEKPVLTSEAVRNFIDKSHDAELGWVRRPGTQGIERGQHGDVRYHIDGFGARALTDGYTPRRAAFGDSYVFCRQVEDDETWEAQWSRARGIGVLNFGVGNYGADQALIRYERTALPSTVTHVILGFVPETICRIHSSWKHYLEFGNTLAFKPRFRLDHAGKLQRVDNVMRTADDFARLDELLPELRQTDGFYRKKFRSVQFRLPYTLSFLRHPLRNTLLMSAVAVRALARTTSASGSMIENLPFSILMRQNIRDAHAMYGDCDATALLNAILRRFVDEARRRGHQPLIVVMPQLLDLRLGGRRPAYCAIFEEIACTLPLLDLTEELQATDFEECYVNDQYGGHFSARGNRLVADVLSRRLATDFDTIND
jgi:hypothetical protein